MTDMLDAIPTEGPTTTAGPAYAGTGFAGTGAYDNARVAAQTGYAINQFQYADAPRSQYYGETQANPILPGRLHRCSRDSHYFECRHELICECGQTARTQAVDIPLGL